jgi:hypothetical protein
MKAGANQGGFETAKQWQIRSNYAAGRLSQLYLGKNVLHLSRVHDGVRVIARQHVARHENEGQIGKVEIGLHLAQTVLIALRCVEAVILAASRHFRQCVILGTECLGYEILAPIKQPQHLLIGLNLLLFRL